MDLFIYLFNVYCKLFLLRIPMDFFSVYFTPSVNYLFFLASILKFTIYEFICLKLNDCLVSAV